MNQKVYLLSATVLTAIFGIGFILLPAQVLALYGVPSNTSMIWLGRFYGGTLVTIALIMGTLIPLAQEGHTKEVILSASLGNAILAFIAIGTHLAGIGNDIVWIAVALYGVFALWGVVVAFK